MNIPRIFTKQELTAMRTSDLFPPHVALVLPTNYGNAAINYYSASMILLNSLVGKPADDRIVAPALALYRQGLELLFKSVLQQKHFLATGSMFDKKLKAELKRHSHSLESAFVYLERLPGRHLVPPDMLRAVDLVISFLEEDTKKLQSLRYGGQLADDELEPFALVPFRDELKKSWVAATTYSAILISCLKTSSTP
jgi:hypothetical protein